MSETPKVVHTSFAEENAQFSDDAAFSSKGFKVSGRKFKAIPFSDVSIGDFNRLCFEWLDVSQWDAEGDKRITMLKVALLDSLYAIYGEAEYTTKEAVADPAKWPPALLKLMEVGLETEWKAGSGKQSVWAAVGGSTVDQWARNILALHKLTTGGSDITSTKVLSTVRSVEDFEKTVLLYMDAFVKAGSHGSISEAKFYDIANKKIGAPGHKLYHPVKWYLGDRPHLSEIVGLLFAGMLWDINGSTSGLNGFALTHIVRRWESEGR